MRMAQERARTAEVTLKGLTMNVLVIIHLACSCSEDPPWTNEGAGLLDDGLGLMIRRRE